MSARSQASGRAARAVALIVIGGFLLPAWTRWSVAATYEYGWATTIWSAVWAVPANWRAVDSVGEFVALHGWNLARLVVLAGLAVAGGAWAYRACPVPEVSDPDGALDHLAALKERGVLLVRGLAVRRRRRSARPLGLRPGPAPAGAGPLDRLVTVKHRLGPLDSSPETSP